MGDKAKASEAFQRAVILNPNSVDALAGLSRSTASTAPATPAGGSAANATATPSAPAAGQAPATTTTPATEGGTP